MTTLELSILKNSLPPKINDIDKVIDHLTRYIAINGKHIPIINGVPSVSKNKLSKMLGVSRPTLDKWINCGFITPFYSDIISKETFDPKNILQQLIDYKSNSEQNNK